MFVEQYGEHVAAIVDAIDALNENPRDTARVDDLRRCIRGLDMNNLSLEESVAVEMANNRLRALELGNRAVGAIDEGCDLLDYIER